MNESEVLVSVIKRQIRRGNTENLQHYTDVFLADHRISEEQRNEIYELLNIIPPAPVVNEDVEDMKAALAELGVTNE